MISFVLESFFSRTRKIELQNSTFGFVLALFSVSIKMNSSKGEGELCKYFQTSHGCKFTADKCKKLHLSREQICKFYQTPNGCKFSSDQCKFAHVKMETSNFHKSPSNTNLQENDEVISLRRSDFEALIATSVKSEFMKMKIGGVGNNSGNEAITSPKFNEGNPAQNLMDIHVKDPLPGPSPIGNATKDPKHISNRKTKAITKSDEKKQDANDVNKVSSTSKKRFKPKSKKESINTSVVAQSIVSECNNTEQLKTNETSKKPRNRSKSSGRSHNSLSKNINHSNWLAHRENDIETLKLRYPSCKESHYKKGEFITFDFHFSKLCVSFHIYHIFNERTF